MLDCIIIGSGVAGISTALTLKANAKSLMMLGNRGLSEKIIKAEMIRNYPGLASISGEDFCKALSAQLDEAEIPITEERAMGVYALKGKFGVATQEGSYYEAKSIVLATGVESTKAIEGEIEFLGRGVSYCATCDGFLYKGKTIAVICTSKRLEHEIDLLAKFAEKVYLIALYKDVAPQKENVVILRKMPVRVHGDMRVNALEFGTAIGENGDKMLAIDGVFALRDSVAPNALLSTLQMQDGHLLVDRNMQTNVEGCFAAGDCTGKPYQYAKAVGEGNVAAHSVCEFLRKNNE